MMRVLVVLIGFLLAGTQAEAAPRSRIDLEIQSIYVQPDPPISNKPITAVAAIQNNGSEVAEEIQVDMRIVHEGEVVAEIGGIPVLSSLPRAGIGQSVPVKIGMLEKGAYELALTVRTRDAVREADSEDNQKSLRFEVKDPPFEGTTYGYRPP